MLWKITSPPFQQTASGWWEKGNKHTAVVTMSFSATLSENKQELYELFQCKTNYKWILCILIMQYFIKYEFLYHLNNCINNMFTYNYSSKIKMYI